MPDLNDFYTYKNTRGGGSGPGCGGSLLVWIFVIYIIISIAAELKY